MFLSRLLGRTLLAAAAKSESSSAVAVAVAAARTATNPLEEFFELDRKSDDEYGRGWKASELRLKSWDDLQKLWYVLLKEKNMLMTQRQMLNAENLRFPNPERIPKVRKSMCRIKHVLTERAISEPYPRRSAEMKRMINALYYCYCFLVLHLLELHLMSLLLAKQKSRCSGSPLTTLCDEGCWRSLATPMFSASVELPSESGRVAGSAPADPDPESGRSRAESG
ncbi:hypothetical protein Taro_002842 [Colocasia esculenta]|uniref:Large ribosomal subunit protein uL29m n=1 Tax=Colocasia esculenta TaxID=4460 RepID=A0A843TKE5_COLES|nr:hypothetical protein [Colocasia esculenta]